MIIYIQYLNIKDKIYVSSVNNKINYIIKKYYIFMINK